MATMTDMEIISQYIGKQVCMENIAKCVYKKSSYSDPSEYTISSCYFLYQPELRSLFGVTDKLKESWERSDVEFKLYIKLRDGMIASCRITKYRDGDGARPSGGGDRKCTQQDLRVARRILQYISI